MADHERNFRTHYYEKVGFRAVEEKKSIEILLREQPVKKEKLVQFCLRFGVPAMYRIYVWKILLGSEVESIGVTVNLRPAQFMQLRFVYSLPRQGESGHIRTWQKL